MKRALAVAPHFLAFLTPVALVAGAHLGGPWTLLPLALVFVALPLLDERIGLDPRQPGDAPAGRARGVWDAPLLLWIPVQLGLTAWVLSRAATAASADAPAWLDLAGLTLSLGVTNGAVGINVAHELMHRARGAERALGEVLMTSVCYPHFCVEHVFGHHRHVATPRDAATSRLGESVYAFVPRSVAGGLRSAWRLERERRGRLGPAALTLRDRRLRHPAALALACSAAAAAFGPLGLAVFVGQGLAAIGLLEVVNYLEHYGLLRREIAPGRYERVGPEHSWNAAQRLSNWYLFNLARHSDHHCLASRPYEQLRHAEAAPQLPAGYATMVLLALVPPLWFRVMNPRVEAWRRRAGATPPLPA